MVEQSLREHLVQATLAIRPGISWPRSQMLLVGVTPDVSRGSPSVRLYTDSGRSTSQPEGRLDERA
jgi:hypothetical protein